MAEQWYYTQQGQRKGPLSEEQLRQMATSGQIQPTDLAWKQGMAEWVQVGTIVPPLPPDLNTPPPLPSASATKGTSKPVDFAALLNLDNRMLLGYRIALIVAMIAVFLPWAQASGSASTMMGKVAAESASISGMDTTWGMIALLVAAAGCFLTFLKPASLMKDKVKLGMSGVGGLIVLLAIIGMATAGSHFGKGMNYADQFGNRASISAGAGFGVYLTLIAGAVSAGLGFVNKWDQ